MPAGAIKTPRWLSQMQHILEGLNEGVGIADDHLRLFSARTISTATPRNDTDPSTVHFQTPNWMVSSTTSRRRIASFDQRAIAAAKDLVNHVSLPSADRLLAAITSFETALTWPETQERIQNLLQRGLQRDRDFETRWPEALGTLLEM